ncbi:MAG: DNA-binding protein WhiA [Lachnospiraceae bacterium]|nr:DNA-binding protein WhiA [Lachnospiraceae bacterium]
MSFSAEVKAELLNIIPSSRHCQLAEIAPIVYFFGALLLSEESVTALVIETENVTIKRKYFTLLAKAFNIKADALTIMQALGYYDKARSPDGITSTLIKSTCCRRAYLRTIFLCIGSMSDPQGGYHLEFVFDHEEQVTQLREVLKSFAIESKVIKRKKNFVVYVKEGASIVDLLNIMGAHNSLLKLESLRVEKEVRNSVNRKVNCETANIGKTVSAAARQIEDIIYIRDKIGFASLPPNLKQTAELRLEYPDITIKELGALLSPPIGKSGVNHRLRKLSEIAKTKVMR